MALRPAATLTVNVRGSEVSVATISDNHWAGGNESMLFTARVCEGSSLMSQTSNMCRYVNREGNGV